MRKPDSMTVDAIGIVVLFAICFGAVVYVLAAGLNAVDNKTFNKGYCAALGGTYLTDDVCNVNGKVVTIKHDK